MRNMFGVRYYRLCVLQLAAVLRGEFSDIIEDCVIVDARYPYEFKAGHIRGALNLYTRESVVEEFLDSDKHKLPRDVNKRIVVVFHCEFSSERGPKL